ncbi:MAG: CAP domain-containing protein, partial [Cyanobacteria bacterium J06627_8]
MLPDNADNTLKNAQKIVLRPKKSLIRNKVGGADPEDYFTFRLKKSSNIRLALTNLRADAGIELLDRKGKSVASSISRGNRKKTIKFNELEKGKYFIRVYQMKGRTQYKLRFSGKPTSTPPKSTPHPFIRDVVALTNAERAKAGLTPLKLNEKLNKASYEHSRDMATGDFFEHTGADGSSPFDRLKANNYRYKSAAENIGAGYSSPESVVRAWMNSPGHRDNILN